MEVEETLGTCCYLGTRLQAKIVNRSFENVAQFKYFGTTVKSKLDSVRNLEGNEFW
jgi:hypothetical protein